MRIIAVSICRFGHNVLHNESTRLFLWACLKVLLFCCFVSPNVFNEPPHTHSGAKWCPRGLLWFALWPKQPQPLEKTSTVFKREADSAVCTVYCCVSHCAFVLVRVRICMCGWSKGPRSWTGWLLRLHNSKLANE